MNWAVCKNRHERWKTGPNVVLSVLNFNSVKWSLASTWFLEYFVHFLFGTETLFHESWKEVISSNASLKFLLILFSKIFLNLSSSIAMSGEANNRGDQMEQFEATTNWGYLHQVLLLLIIGLIERSKFQFLKA